ncbi:MAG: putative Fe-S cluster assembly protein SufT, partial [Gammaproteobacteria bacterium]|nr:putative Fe-S cluster assembly protein SufT [Gammaproteobacteria bacterium]
MRSHDNEPFVVNREVKAVIVPAGVEVSLKPGQSGYITQALGGSFTVYMEGNLFRISGEDADALGKEPVKAPELPPNATENDVRELAWAQMRTCYDPEIPINIVDLGLVYECTLSTTSDGKKRVDVKMTLTAPGCGMGGILSADVQEKIESVPSVKEAHVEIVFDPPWSRDMMSEEAKLQ